MNNCPTCNSPEGDNDALCNDSSHVKQRISAAKAESALLSLFIRAQQHPRVLEIMADCADIIDAENSAVDPALDVNTKWMRIARDLRSKAKAIRKEDPELWGASSARVLVPLNKLRVGAYYAGECRNASVARWDGKVFEYIRREFGSSFIETAQHPEKDDGHDLFYPLRLVYDPDNPNAQS